MTFRELDALVGGLPASARQYPAWWANTRTAQPHSYHWLDAGRRAKPDFNGQRVRFELGSATAPRSRTSDRSRGGVRKSGRRAKLDPTGEFERVTVEFEWLDAGQIKLDRSDKPVFLGLPTTPGVYRFMLLDADASLISVYIGQSDNLARRMTGYRNPAPKQTTNMRMNASIVDALNNGGTVRLNLSTSATIDRQPADLSRSAVRLLMENAALANALRDGQPVENL